jgi:Holliday junction resolvase-like predicted endonuclease
VNNDFLYLSMIAGLLIAAVLVRYEYRLQEREAKAQGVEPVSPREQQRILRAAAECLADDAELESVVRRWKEVV